jgi:hypothetical protein
VFAVRGDWTGVGFDVELSDDRIESDDSGDYATVTGEATLSTDGFPQWVAVRYDTFRGSYEDAWAIARYPDATPRETVDGDDYEAVDFEETRSGAERVPGGPTVHDVRFDPSRPVSEDRRGTNERTSRGEAPPGSARRALPAGTHPSRYRERRADRGGWPTAGARFRRTMCLYVPWSISLDVDRAGTCHRPSTSAP